MADKQKIYDVIIVGGGPVGLFLACELAEAGIEVLVLEASAERLSPLKAAPFGIRGLSVATVDAFYRRHLLSDLIAAAKADMPSKAPSQKGADKRGGHFSGLPIDFSKVDETKWKYRLPGPASQAMGASMQSIESVLLARATALGVAVRSGVRVTGAENRSDGVSLIAGEESFDAKWLVGCDGGRSEIRRTLGFEFLGTEAQFTAYYGLVNLEGAEKLKPGRNLTPNGFYAIPLPGFVTVMEFDGGQFDRKKGITREHFQEVLRRVSGTDVAVTDLKLATSFTDRAKLATQYKIGRVLLAGDAAHIHSPLGGQGLNLGIGDALNLGWKLASVIKAQAPESLLDSYFGERHPVAKAVLDFTRPQVQLMKPDPHSQALRKIVCDLIATRDGATYFADRLWGISLRYELGSDHPLVGSSMPDFEFFDGTRAGEAFTGGQGLLLEFGSGEGGLTCLAQEYPGRVKHICKAASNNLSLSALLVRPDGVVAWARDQNGDTDELRTVAARWFGQ